MALKTASLKLQDIDLIELNEAFAVQVLAVQRDMPFAMEKCNVHDGAIALEHPIGAVCAKILTTLIYALQTYDRELGLVSAFARTVPSSMVRYSSDFGSCGLD